MIKFGTGGWRAFIGEEFTRENVRLVAQALANIINNEDAAKNGFVMLMRSSQRRSNSKSQL